MDDYTKLNYARKVAKKTWVEVGRKFNLADMGVRGLATYIKANGRKFLKTHKLHNCYVILDGYNIATNLFLSLNTETAFGGNYDVYALHIKDFFKLLKKCQIKPLVVFDGGYERRKIRTVYKRMQSKISSAKNVRLGGSTPNFPLFMRHIFREVLVELGIPFAQCDFEADVEIAALARELQCPVLSYDSDFYIFDVMYIPFPTVTLEAIPFVHTHKNKEVEYYLKCNLYEIDYFLNSFGGLDKTMLPLLATVLGNDYINKSVFKSFFEQFKVTRAKKKNSTQVLIGALLKWFRNESLETALCKILGRMKQHKRKFVAFKVNSIIRGYTKYSSVLDSYLSIQTTRSDVNKLDINHIINQIENTTTLEDEEENDSGESYKEECSDDDLDESNDILSESINTDNENGEDFEIPYWILDSMRKGNIHSSVMDILTLRMYFCPIQVEDYTLSHSHGISLPILNVIIGLLLGSDQRIKYWARNRYGRLDWFSLDSVGETKTIKFPRLEFLNQMPLFEKRLILLETLDLGIDLDLFPKDWQLFVIAVLFWLKNMKEPVVTISHLHTLIMCILDLQVISKKIGCYSKKKYFTKKYSKQLKKISLVSKAVVGTQTLKIKENKDNIDKDNGTDGNEMIMTNFIESCSSVTEVEKQGVINIENINSSVNSKSKPTNITEILNYVTKEDCILKFETLLPFHHLKDQLLIKPKLFCIMSVHSFAQFQSCLHHIMLLNSLLDFPLNQCFVSKFYSGIFAYNVFSELSTKKNIDMYVRSLFKSAPSLLTLYESILNTFLSMLPCGHLADNSIKIKRRKKKGKSKKIGGGVFTNVVKETGDEEFFMDENNKFSLLAIS